MHAFKLLEAIDGKKEPQHGEAVDLLYVLDHVGKIYFEHGGKDSDLTADDKILVVDVTGSKRRVWIERPDKEIGRRYNLLRHDGDRVIAEATEALVVPDKVIFTYGVNKPITLRSLANLYPRPDIMKDNPRFHLKIMKSGDLTVEAVFANKETADLVIGSDDWLEKFAEGFRDQWSILAELTPAINVIVLPPEHKDEIHFAMRNKPNADLIGYYVTADTSKFSESTHNKELYKINEYRIPEDAIPREACIATFDVVFRGKPKQPTMEPMPVSQPQQETPTPKVPTREWIPQIHQFVFIEEGKDLYTIVDYDQYHNMFMLTLADTARRGREARVSNRTFGAHRGRCVSDEGEPLIAVEPGRLRPMTLRY